MYGYTPSRGIVTLFIGLATGALIFNVVIGDNLKGIIGDFPKEVGIVAYGLLWLGADLTIARRRLKQYKKDLQESLDLLEQQERKEASDHKD